MKLHQRLYEICYFLPFGFGARSCIGKKLAENEIEYFIYEFLDNFVIKITNDEAKSMGDISTMEKSILTPNFKMMFEITRK